MSGGATIAGALGLALVAAQAAEPPGFAVHAEFRGVGGCLNTIVGPGPQPGTQRVYASHIYGGNTLDIIAIDPETGRTEAFSSPVPSEVGAWALVLGPDQQVYVGTLPAAHVLKLDWAQRKLVDLGRPSDTEQYIWQWAVGSDRKLYGCTYPSAKLVRFDPVTGKGEDLGRMDLAEQYARTVAADDAGFVYTGIGMAKAHLVAYEIATGQHRDILPVELQVPGAPSVYRGDDGRVYAVDGGKTLRLTGFTCEAIDAAKARPAAPPRLADGRIVSYDGRRVLTVTDPKSGAARQLKTDYSGKAQAIFRLGLGPDEQLYGSTAMPIHFFQVNPDSNQWSELGQPGGGEFYSFLAWRDRLLGAAYGGDAPLMVYRPGQPYQPQTKPTGNPWLVHYEGQNSGWRPMAMVAGPQDKIYLGAVAGYGLLGGPLTVWDPVSGKVEAYHHLVKDQSVIALALLPNGLLAGATTIGGGGGSHPTQTEAKLFLWDPIKREKLFEMVPAPGVGAVYALAVSTAGQLYVFAGPRLVRFDPQTRTILETIDHGLPGVIYNSVQPGPGGKLYGLTSDSIFVIDPATHRPTILATYPGGIHGGIAIKGQRIFFSSGPKVISYTVP